MSFIFDIGSTDLFLDFIKPIIFQEEDRLRGNSICRLLQPPLASKLYCYSLIVRDQVSLMYCKRLNYIS